MNIFVGRLSYETQESNLRALFEEIGQVKSLKIITDRETGKSKGFAFVTMANREDGQKAITQLDGTALDGRNISVSEAEDRKSNERKPAGGQGGQRPEFKPRREESREEDDFDGGGKPEKGGQSLDWSEAPTKGAPRKNSPNKKKKESLKGRGGDDDGFRKKKMPPKPSKSKKNRGWGEDDDDDIFGDFKF
ncbi:RNA recognition motif-containing protein [Roseivirga ehrenbergii]|uniref:RNA recognition motif domain-containing protein n=1 Tax=Roseivirga ehrenbergii (strain DSM 102268 / JCM 13514 / KCTC 12282 / NCIMB 14502 / KMM 6017) TaxID=279360 RepID=UPI0009FFC327|nr:hypothetical protein [Roseivirga ehrenbergii]TCL13385.1 RNA recognition motif-containing protein [Roseivirga ehrenbergii]